MARPSKVPVLLAALDADGAVRRRRELVSDFGENAVSRAKDDGLIHELLPALYAHADHHRSLHTRVAAALLWLSPEAVASGAAACSLHGLKVRKVLPITITVDTRRRMKVPGWLRLRRYITRLPAVTVSGLRVVELPCALIQVWIDEGPRTGRGLILDAIRNNRTEALTILERFRYFPKISRRREFREFLARLRDGIESYLEWLADQTILNVPDLAHLERQKEFWVDGEHFFVDAYCSQTMTAFEFDGKAYHNDDAARRRDLARDRALATIGVQVIRFTFQEVEDEPERCRETIRKTIAARRRSAA